MLADIVDGGFFLIPVYSLQTWRMDSHALFLDLISTILFRVPIRKVIVFDTNTVSYVKLHTIMLSRSSFALRAALLTHNMTSRRYVQ